jgi:hypothetical protein
MHHVKGIDTFSAIRFYPIVFVFKEYNNYSYDERNMKLKTL